MLKFFIFLYPAGTLFLKHREGDKHSGRSSFFTRHLSGAGMCLQAAGPDWIGRSGYLQTLATFLHSINVQADMTFCMCQFVPERATMYFPYKIWDLEL